MKIVIAGGNSFLGRALSEAFRDHEVVTLIRHNEHVPGTKTVAWTGLRRGPWEDEIDGADVVVNYAGAPITLKWSADNQKAIKESRIQSTYLIGQAIEGSANPPKVWLNASAVGYYGSRGSEILDESSAFGTGFMAELCRNWEGAQMQEALPHTRRVALRTGVVLGKGGGALKPLVRLTKLFMGGRQGDGHQWMPWIHIDDHVGIVKHLIERDVSGPVNLVGPRPVQNAEFMATLRKVVGRPPAPPAPIGMLKLVGKLFGPDPEVVLASLRVMPKVAQETGYGFKYPTLEPALRQILR